MNPPTVSALMGGAPCVEALEPQPLARPNRGRRHWPDLSFYGFLLIVWVIAMTSALRNPTSMPANGAAFEMTAP